MGDLFTLEYGKPVEDKDSIDGPIPVFGTNGQIGTSHLAPLCNHPSVILGRKGAYRGVHFSDRPFSVIDTAFYVEPLSDVFDIKWLYYKLLTYDINSMDSGSAIPSTGSMSSYQRHTSPRTAGCSLSGSFWHTISAVSCGVWVPRSCMIHSALRYTSRNSRVLSSGVQYEACLSRKMSLSK